MNSELHDQLALLSQNLTWYIGIGDVASATGVSRSQLRYWEEKGYIQSNEAKGQNRKYTYDTLIRVAIINHFLTQGFTLAAAVTKADAHKETINVLRQFLSDRIQDIGEQDGYPAINLGKLDADQSETLFAVVKKDRTDFKLVKHD